MTDYTPKPLRCPHDGAFCHHSCATACSRKAMGDALSTPYSGYPKPGDAPVMLSEPSAEDILIELLEMWLIEHPQATARRQ